MARLSKVLLPLFGLGILIFLLTNADLAELSSHISRANILYVAGSMACYLMAISIRMAKWWIFSNVVSGLKSRLDVFSPLYCLIHLLGNLTPMRSGEMTGPILLKQYIRLSYPKGIALVIIETSVEATIFAVGVIAAIFYFSTSYSSVIGIPKEFLWLASGLGCVVLGSLILVRRYKMQLSSKLFSSTSTYLRGKIPTRFLVKLGETCRETMTGVRLFGITRVLCITVPMTILAWMLDILRIYLMLCALGEFDLFDVAASFMVVALFSMMTMVPLGLGVAEVGWIFVLTNLGHDQTLVISAMFMERALHFLLLMIIALVAVVRLSFLKSLGARGEA